MKFINKVSMRMHVRVKVNNYFDKNNIDIYFLKN
jgi:hypothetical protein